MPKQFGRFKDPSGPTDSGSQTRVFARVNDYAVRHPVLGSVLQGFVLGALLTVLGVLKDLPNEPEIVPILLIGATTAVLFSLVMVPVNSWRRARLSRLIETASLRSGQNAPEHP